MANDRIEREQERRAHIAQLAAARHAALSRLHRRFRVTCVLLAATLVSFGTVPFVAGGSIPAGGSEIFASLTGEVATIGELTVRSLRVVDEGGREVAYLGREPGGASPVVLGLFSPDGDEDEQVLRLASTEHGAAITVRNPSEDSAVTLLASGVRPQIQLKRGARTRVISDAEARGPKPVLNPAPRRPEVDLTLRDVQPIGDGFMVGRLGVDDDPRGVRVRGRVINTTSLEHSDLRFRVHLAGRVETFEVSRVSPGNSTGFSVHVPELTLADAERASFEYLGSRVRYAVHDLRGQQDRATVRP